MATKVLTASGAIKASEGNLIGLSICTDGVTSADSVEIKDAATDTGDAVIKFVFGPTDDYLPFFPYSGMHFDTGIYCKITKNSGTVTVSAVYD
jgi:hypothetical protein